MDRVDEKESVQKHTDRGGAEAHEVLIEEFISVDLIDSHPAGRPEHFFYDSKYNQNKVP